MGKLRAGFGRVMKQKSAQVVRLMVAKGPGDE